MLEFNNSIKLNLLIDFPGIEVHIKEAVVIFFVIIRFLLIVYCLGIACNFMDN